MPVAAQAGPPLPPQPNQTATLPRSALHSRRHLYRYGAAAVLGNTDPIGMWRVQLQRFGISGGERYAASYPAHLSPKEHRRSTNITNDYQILLFHYVTRAQNNFIERKINRQSGVYATTYREIQGNATADADTDELYARFEHEYGFDGDHTICRQGSRLSAAMDAARSSGAWSPIPSQPGLILREAAEAAALARSSGNSGTSTLTAGRRLALKPADWEHAL